MSQRDNEMNGRGCLGVMAALLAVPVLTIGLGVAATLSMSGCAVAGDSFEDKVKAQPAQCRTDANYTAENTICEGLNSAASTGNLEFTVDEGRALAGTLAVDGCSNQCGTDVGWITFGKRGGVGFARAGTL